MKKLFRPLQDNRTHDVGRIIVRSNIMASIGFDRRNQSLQIEFLNGAVCEIAGASEQVYRNLVASKDIDRSYRDLDLSNLEYLGKEHPLFC